MARNDKQKRLTYLSGLTLNAVVEVAEFAE